MCQNTNEEITFLYGQDAMVGCLWAIDDVFYKFLQKVIMGHAQYQCRVPLSKDHSVYLPFSITLWGMVEPTHIHVMNHLQFIFHAGK